MKRIFNKFVKPKKPKSSSLTISDALGSSRKPATSRSAIITSTAHSMPSVPASAAVENAEVIQVTSVAVSIQLCPSYSQVFDQRHPSDFP
ncbi:hypothetical protein BYT27DRAFT_6691573 [Phlegmacium glaucopus]|nr:hypothetical protein BYT27DRAFT_6691573 [Phlegmacium glaucopus]